MRGARSTDLLVDDIDRYLGDMVPPSGARFIETEAPGSGTLSAA